MSDFGEALFDLLPVNSRLQNKRNQGRKVIDNTVGEWFDHHDILDFYDNLFLDTCNGAYLDLFGKDYGVTRQLDESDEDYRVRIIQEKNDRLTPAYLESLYGLALYVYIDGFNVVNNTLTSDNPFISNEFMSAADDTVISILNNKFMLGNGIHWLVDGSLDYLLNTSNVNVISDYMDIYKLSDLKDYFSGDTSLVKVNLNLSATNVAGMFYGCTGLTDVYLDLPNAKHPASILRGCTGLINVTLSIPRAIGDYSDLVLPSSSSTLKYLNLTVINSFKNSYITVFSNSTNFPNLETLIVNGEEVDLS